jgi:hypothetical protein
VIIISENWHDRDGDGIPDKFDREPDKPAKTALEKHLQDMREDWVGPHNYKCPLCDKRFTTHKAYDKHYETHLQT